MKNLYKKGLGSAELYPFPFKQGGKMNSGEITDTPKFGPGGKPPVPKKPGVKDFVGAAFSPQKRDEYRYARKVNKSLEGKGSQEFRAASNFKIPSSGQTAKPGQQVLITPQAGSIMTSPGKPAIPAIPTTPDSIEKRFTGNKSDFIPGFTETGAYGKPVAGAPTSGDYTGFPDKMNPNLKMALQQAIQKKEPTAMYKGKPFKAGQIVETPQYEDVVIPGSPGQPGQPSIPPTYEGFQSFIARTGGYKEKGKNWKIGNQTDLEHISRGSFDKVGGGKGKYKKQTKSN